MFISRETKISDSICLALVLLCGILHLAGPYISPYISENSIIFVCYTVAFFIWIYQIRRRLLQKYVRKYLIGAASLMIFWMAIRTVKYSLLPMHHVGARYIWYLYYFPYIFIPLLMIFALLCVGKGQKEDMDRKWKLLYIPAVAMMLGIMTNDLHFQAFRFPDGLRAWTDSDMIRGPLYYIVTTWIILLFLIAITLAFIHCRVPAIRKRIWVPILPFAVGFLYVVLYILDSDIFIIHMFRAPEIACVLFAAFMESLIVVHLFPSNDSYGDFWRASSIGAGIMDNDGNLRFSSGKCIPVTAEQVYGAKGSPAVLDRGDTVLGSKKIHGGYCYWVRDISEINSLNSRLADLGDVLADENAMIDAENKMEEKRTRTEQQSRLYDSVAKGVRPQLDKLDNILRNLDDDTDEETFVHSMEYACVLNAYIKRYSNLILISDGAEDILAVELRLALEESLEYGGLCGAQTCVTGSNTGRLPFVAALLMYRLFEEVLETAIPGADGILADLETEDTSMIHIEVSRPGTPLGADVLGEEIAAAGGSFSLEYSEDEAREIVSLSFAKGGPAC